MDAKRWTDMRDLFSAGARFSTPRMGRGSERRDAFMAALERQLDGVVTVHHGHMPEIVFSGADEARGIWALHDQLEWPAGGPDSALFGIWALRGALPSRGRGLENRRAPSQPAARGHRGAAERGRRTAQGRR